jgi:hypothetical protein
VSIGLYAVIRAEEINDDGDMVPIGIAGGSNFKRVTPDSSGFPESAAQANHELVKGCKRIRNEF